MKIKEPIYRVIQIGNEYHVERMNTNTNQPERLNDVFTSKKEADDFVSQMNKEYYAGAAPKDVRHVNTGYLSSPFAFYVVSENNNAIVSILPTSLVTATDARNIEKFKDSLNDANFILPDGGYIIYVVERRKYRYTSLTELNDPLNYITNQHVEVKEGVISIK